MARMIEEVIVIKVSRLVKDDPTGTVTDTVLLDGEVLGNLAAVMQELVGTALVELQVV